MINFFSYKYAAYLSWARLLPMSSLRGLLGAELTCRWTAIEVDVMLKDAWRAILAFLRSWPAIGCVASGGGMGATFTVFPTEDEDDDSNRVKCE